MSKLSEETVGILNQCTVEGNNVKLPDTQLSREAYVQVKKALEGIGGKWKGGKVAAFVFSSNPSELLTTVQGGTKVNLKKDFQFFATPDKLADKLVEMAEINDPCLILEPSAGDGAIVKAINRKFPTLSIDVFELMPQNVQKLEELSSDIDLTIMYTSTQESDFTKADPSFLGKYDRVIANPPFTKNQDIQHVMMMYNCLKKGGRVVSIMSNHYTFSDDTQSKQFRRFLESVGAKEYDVPNGAFKESGTMVNTKIVVIDKA